MVDYHFQTETGDIFEQIFEKLKPILREVIKNHPSSKGSGEGLLNLESLNGEPIRLRLSGNPRLAFRWYTVKLEKEGKKPREFVFVDVEILFQTYSIKKTFELGELKVGK